MLLILPSSVCRGAPVPSTFIFTAERMLSRTTIDIPVRKYPSCSRERRHAHENAIDRFPPDNLSSPENILSFCLVVFKIPARWNRLRRALVHHPRRIKTEKRRRRERLFLSAQCYNLRRETRVYLGIAGNKKDCELTWWKARLPF